MLLRNHTHESWILQIASTKMSWTNPNTGRPKEEGGHQRINISLDDYTRQVLDNVPNKSVFIEQTVCEYTQLKVEHFNQYKGVSNETSSFKNAAVFVYKPTFNNCEIKQVNVIINYFASDGNAEFRLVINNQKCPSLAQKNLPGHYTLSHSCHMGEMGFTQFESFLRGKDKFIFKIQFRSLKLHSSVIVKRVKMFIELIDSPLIESTSLENLFLKSQEKVPDP